MIKINNVEKINIDQTIKNAAEEGAKKAVSLLNKEIRDNRIHNTKLLMKNYNKLKDHIDKVKSDIEFEIEQAEDKVWLTSIVRTKLRTMQLIAFIDNALDLVKEDMKKNCVEYKYKAFEMYYLEEKSNEEIVSKMKCGKNQPRIWSDVILNELSIYLWGIEALGI